jgi:hypothetical protein
VRALAVVIVLLPAAAAADRLVAPSDFALQGVASGEAGLVYARAGVDLPMDDAYVHTVGVSLTARVALLDGLLVGVAGGAIVDQSVDAFAGQIEIAEATGFGDVALTAEWLLRLGEERRWKLGARAALWLPTGAEGVGNDAVAVDAGVVAAARTSRTVELFATAAHLASVSPDRFDVAAGLHLREDNWSFVPRAFLRFDSPADDAERGAVGFGGELGAAIEIIPDVSFRLVVDLARDRVTVGDDQLGVTTLGVAGFVQGTRDLF